MNDQALDQISSYLAGGAFAVLFLAFVLHIAELVTASRTRALVTADVASSDGRAEGQDEQVAVPDRLAAVGLSVTTLGAILLVAATVLRGVAAGRLPLGNMYEFGLVGISVALVVYLVLVRVSGDHWLATGVLAFSLLVLGLSLSTYVPAGPLVPALDTFWKYIHVSSIMVAAGFFVVGAAASLLFLVKNRAEENGSTNPVLGRFPRSGRIDQISFRANAIGFPLWTFGTLISGPIWAHYAWSRYWAWDPKEVWALITWIVYAGYLHARVTAGWKGKRAAWIGLVGFATFVISYYVVNLFAVGLHSYAK